MNNATTAQHNAHAKKYPKHNKVPGSGGLSKERGVGRGDVVELYGPSGSGKSEVLINVVARCILPAWLGGDERTAVFFDNGERL